MKYWFMSGCHSSVVRALVAEVSGHAGSHWESNPRPLTSATSSLECHSSVVRALVAEVSGPGFDSQ